MLKVLSRRWLGVTVWAYLLALSLAMTIYWLLPKDATIHRWTFDGAVAVVGFTHDHSQMVVAIQDGFAFLNLKTGMVDRVSDIKDSDRQRLVVPEKLPYKLSHYRYGFIDASPVLDLINTGDGNIRNVPVNDSTVDVADMYFVSASHSSATVELSTAGMVAMSPDQSRLLLPSRRFSNWFRLKHWMAENWKWSPSFLPDGTSYHMLIVNLSDNSLTEHELRSHQDVEFVIHPAGTGFAVVDREWFQPRCTPPIMAIPTSKPFNISWFALPPGTALPTTYQWLAIIGAFVIPVMFSFCRRKRHLQVSDSSTDLPTRSHCLMNLAPPPT